MLSDIELLPKTPSPFVKEVKELFDRNIVFANGEEWRYVGKLI